MKKLLTQSWKIVVALIALYLVTHLWQLTLLPVFADEAIYIRWAQLIIDDAKQYLFFPLNDGKTPLFMWLLVPFQYLSSNQLWSARLLSVLIGFGQVLSLGWLVHTLGGRRWTVWLSMFFVCVLPFWFFHHRLALIDSLLALTLTLAWVGSVQIAHQKKGYSWTIWTGVWLGVALWTKVPAVLAFPGLITTYLLIPEPNRNKIIRTTMQLGIAGVLGLLIFAVLRLSPAFGQLFSRGSDFLYPVSEVLKGEWRQTLPNFPTYVSYFIHYLSPQLLLLIVIGLFLPSQKRSIHALFWTSLLFFVPILLLGKVVYPRYFLPMAIWLTAAAALACEAFYRDIPTPTQLKESLGKHLVSGVVLVFILANVFGSAGTFMLAALTNPGQLPLVGADQTQYLGEWSSGHGIVETVALIRELRSEGTLAVATEGYFGTLPDGLVLYFHRQPVDGIYIDGIGQPVAEIREPFRTRAVEYDRSILVVNSHRMLIKLPSDKLLAEYCRPIGTICLQVWDITEQIRP